MKKAATKQPLFAVACGAWVIEVFAAGATHGQMPGPNGHPAVFLDLTGEWRVVVERLLHEVGEVALTLTGCSYEALVDVSSAGDARLFVAPHSALNNLFAAQSAAIVAGWKQLRKEWRKHARV